MSLFSLIWINRTAKHLDAILVSTLISDMGLQFLRYLLSSPFFSINVITACRWELDKWLYAKDKFNASIRYETISLKKHI